MVVVLTGVDDARNHSGGLRLARESATLEYAQRTPLSSWRAWQQERFGVDADDPLVAGATADPDGDGLANLLEYALGGDPRSSGSHLFPRIRAVGTDLEIRCFRDPTATAAELACQRSDSPAGEWTDIARAVAGGPLAALVPEVEIGEQDHPDGLREVTISLLPGHPARGFFRLEARLAEE